MVHGAAGWVAKDRHHLVGGTLTVQVFHAWRGKADLDKSVCRF